MTELCPKILQKLEEWLEPIVSGNGDEKGIVQVIPKFEVLKIKSCPKLTGMPSTHHKFSRKSQIWTAK